MTIEDKYIDAVWKPGLRNGFLRRVYREIIIPNGDWRFVSRIINRFDSGNRDPDGFWGADFMEAVPSFLTLLGIKGIRSSIIVYDAPFDNGIPWIDFHSGLMNEVENAKQFYYHPESALRRLW